MDLAAYQKQLAGLRQFADFPQVPRDPYNILVGLARELLGYQSLSLTRAQQAAYDGAVVKAREHGPCCCGCWRWDTFAGQARYLIAHRGFGASRVALVWDLEDGCGG